MSAIVSKEDCREDGAGVAQLLVRMVSVGTKTVSIGRLLSLLPAALVLALPVVGASARVGVASVSKASPPACRPAVRNASCASAST